MLLPLAGTVMALGGVTSKDLIRFGDDFELDVRLQELRRSGQLLKLERIPMGLLLLLIEQRGQLVSRDQIVERLWGKDVFLDTDNGINGAIRKVRQVLKDDPEQPRFVQTLTGRGYRFIAPAEEICQPSSVQIAPDAQTPPSGNLIGSKISHYRVLQLLGGGGMGVVYQAEDLKLGRRVALKFLPGELASNPKAFQRFEFEARAASALDHPNICSIYELGEHEGQPFIVMQLLEGQTLREWIENPPGKAQTERLDDLLNFAIQIAHGLEAAHQKGIIHRDIKPANIFITRRGQAKILDFGVAKFVDATETVGATTGAAPLPLEGETSTGEAHLTRTGDSVGTPFYLSPEQILRGKVDSRTDLFSFGLVLYEMSTGRRAFSGNTATVIRDAVLNLPAVPVRHLNSAAPAELERIINKALEKNPDHRYQTTGEMRFDIEHLQAGLQPVSSGRLKARLWISVSIALIALLLFGLNVGRVRDRVFQRNQARDVKTTVTARPSVAVLGFKNLSGKNEKAWISTALSEMLGAQLAAGQQLRVVPAENVARMKLDLSLTPADSYGPDTLNKIHNDLSTDIVVVGSYLAVGKDTSGKIRIDLQMQDTRGGETLAVLSRDGLESDLADLVTQGGAGLRQKLGVGEVAASDARQARASVPTNLEAERLYAEGLSRLHNFDALAARDLLQKAIAADPDHALSHSALAESWAALGYIIKAQAEARKAFDLSANLPRADRLLVEGRYRELSPDFPSAIEIYRTLRNFFPDDLEFGLRLASAQSHGGFAKDALQTVAQMRALPDPQRQDARIDLAEAKAAEHLGDFGLMQHAATSAAGKAQAQGSRMMMAEAREQEGWAWGHLGELDKAMSAYAQARELASLAGNPNTSAAVLYGMATALLDKGDYEGARKFYEDSLKIYRQIGSQQDAAFAVGGIGDAFFVQGRMEEAKRYYQEALRVHRQLGDPTAMGEDLGNIANTLTTLGNLAEAAQMQEQSLQAYRQVGNKLGEATTLAALGTVLTYQGELDAARQTLEQALIVEQQSGQVVIRGYVLTSLADILIAQDRLPDARASAEQALALRKEHNEESLIASSQLQIAEIALEQGKVGEAESLARASSAVFDRQKAILDGSQSYALLARTLLAQGKTQDARAAADRALSLSQQSGDIAARFNAILAAQAVQVEAGKFEQAAKTLGTLLQETGRYGYVGFALEARLRLGELELRSGKTTTGRDRLQLLQNDARRKGFLLIARKAAEAQSVMRALKKGSSS